MPKAIKSIVDRINLLNKKGLGVQYTPEQICEEIHAESLNLWKKYLIEFEQTQKISMFLDPFKAKETVTLTSGAGTLVTSLKKYRTGLLIPSTDIPVTLIDIAHWGSAVNDSVRVPSATYPIARIDNAAIIVRPTTIASVDVHFLGRPTKPVFAYTLDSDDYIYSDGSSVDYEWSEEANDEIINRVLSNLGLSQREGELMQYSNIEKIQEGK